MILFILLTVLSVGIVCFMVGQYWEQRKEKNPLQLADEVDNQPEPGSRIKKDLDYLLRLYQQGVLSEEQYFDQADQLIDELASLLDNDLNGKDYAAIRNS